MVTILVKGKIKLILFLSRLRYIWNSISKFRDLNLNFQICDLIDSYFQHSILLENASLSSQ